MTFASRSFKNGGQQLGEVSRARSFHTTSTTGARNKHVMENANAAKEFVKILKSERREYKEPKILDHEVRSLYKKSLKFIEKDKVKQQSKLEALKKQGASPKELEKQEVFCHINDPKVRWNFRNKQEVDMSKPVYRRLAEDAWRREGGLGKLMYSATRELVIPDAIGFFAPTVDLRLGIPNRGHVYSNQSIQPRTALQEQYISVRAFHPETRLYSLIIFDPDSPDLQTESYKNYVHYMKTNIPISATDGNIPKSKGTLIQSYIPFHPQSGTGRHRYTYILLEQPDKIQVDSSRWGQHRTPYDVRGFINEYNLKPAGIHFLRSGWTPTVSKIYKEILNEPEPNYGPVPKLNIRTAYGRQEPNKYEIL